MRNKPSKAAIYEGVLSLPDVNKSLAEIKERLEKLEAEVFATGVEVLPSPVVKRKKGRRPLLEQKILLERRDNLTNWIERNWPYLSVALRKTRSSPDAIAAIIAAKKRMPGLFQPPFYKDPDKYATALCQFLKSGRFNGNPRNLAGAMAGLPELSWKRSLDVCSTHPCKHPLATEAYWDYMRRYFPDRWQELRQTTTEEQALAVLAKSRTHDPAFNYLKEQSGNILKWFNAGDPSKMVLNRRQGGYRE